MTVNGLKALAFIAIAPTAMTVERDTLSTRQYQIAPQCRPYSQGIVSWYGHGFHGRPMAGGKPYNQWAYTAAHRDLPLGSVVRVTVSGRRMYLPVTDRGPYVRGRMLDVSRAAAVGLGIERQGLARARIDLCG